MSLSRKIAETIVRNGIETADVVPVLESYGLIGLLPSIVAEAKKLAVQEGDRETIHIESPFPLDDEASKRIKRIVGNDLASVSVSINKDLLAGFKARYKGKLYDGSAERIIKQLTK